MSTKLKENDWIDDEILNYITMKNVAPPKIYGQPKIHKRGIPLRPVVASYESPNYNVSKFLASILKNLTKSSTYNVFNSSHFVNKAASIKLSSNDCCVSFDVKSLFTKVYVYWLAPPAYPVKVSP